MTGKPRKPGRPRDQDRDADAREALLVAASRLFAERGADAVSVREVAEQAGVSPAMISYYFSDKRGLMRAVLEHGLDRILAVVREAAENHSGAVASTFIDRYIHAINADPSLPHLMVREVLAGNAGYRAVIREQFAQKALAMMPARILEDISEGRIRSDLDPRLTMMSVIGMCIFPYLAAPLLKPLLGYEFDDAFADALSSHTVKLFNEGALPR